MDQFLKNSQTSQIHPSEIDTLNGLTPIEQVEARVLKCQSLIQVTTE